MRVLYLINAGIMGGRERHVMTLVKSLPKEIEFCVCAVSAGEATDKMFADGLNVRVLGGRNGHDLRILRRFVSLLKEFKPDIVHTHSVALLPYFVLNFFPRIALVQSIHGPSLSGAEWEARRRSLAWKVKGWLAGLLQRRPDYCLPVSQSTWNEFKAVYPWARGEVFYNALNLDALPKTNEERKRAGTKIVGMVGRMADQKDWPSFVKIARQVRDIMPDVEFWGVGASEKWARTNITGDIGGVKWFGTRQDARELIAKMEIFIMTSKHEQLPTTMLEAFALKVPVVGFLPEGGTAEVLALSRDGEAALMVKDRDCAKVADLVVQVLSDASLRDRMVQAGCRIVTEHFDMKKLCATQLLGVYKRLTSKEA